MSHAYQKREYEFTSPLALVHTITHNLNTVIPIYSVYDSSDLSAVIPQTTTPNNANQLTFVLYQARAIYGRIIE